jgi:N-acetylglucosamine-6-sulfatase
MSGKLSRRQVLNSAVLLAAAGTKPAKAMMNVMPAGQRRTDTRPNIIFVIVDDMRHDDTGGTGHPYAKTPNLDRVGREGVTFDFAHCTTPLCSPSRASFHTGLYVHSHRIINNDKVGLAELSHRLPTMERILFNAGYETAFVGKWHMGFDDTARPGFDYWVSYRAQGLYNNNTFNVNGTRVQTRGYASDFLNEHAMKFIEQEHDRPFMLQMAHKAVHYPYLPAPRFEKLYEGKEHPMPAFSHEDREGKPALRLNPPPLDVLTVEGVMPEPQESRYHRGMDASSMTRDRARCLASVDEGMGMIFDALERTRQLDNTLIIFTADHGYMMGEHGVLGHKRWPYEPSTRIPMMMRFPKLIPRSVKRSQPVLNVDIAPTLLAIAGVQPPLPMHGKPLLDVLKSADAPLRDSFLSEYFMEKFDPQVPAWRSVTKGGWKYVHYTTVDGMDELYDMRNDPPEEKNVIVDPANAELVAAMKAELNKLLAETQTDLEMV